MQFRAHAADTCRQLTSAELTSLWSKRLETRRGSFKVRSRVWDSSITITGDPKINRCSSNALNPDPEATLRFWLSIWRSGFQACSKAAWVKTGVAGNRIQASTSSFFISGFRNPTVQLQILIPIPGPRPKPRTTSKLSSHNNPERPPKHQFTIALKKSP